MDLKKQNILFFSRSTQHGGTENVILQLCEILRTRVNNIVICSAQGISSERFAELGVKHYIIDDIEDKNFYNIRSTIRLIKKIVKTEKITVIHTHHRMAAFYVSLLRLYKQCYFINTSHNTFDNKKLLTQFAYKQANLIACGEMVKRNLVEAFHLPDHQITVIHNAVKPFDGNVVIDPLIKQFHDEGYVVIGNIGRLSRQKGMEYFIKAIPKIIKKHSAVKFIIAGDGEERKMLEDLAKYLGIENDLFFLGYRNDVQNLMSQLDLIVLSSLWEGLPLTPIEAYSVGRTMIATAVDGTIEIVRDGVDGCLISPQNVEDIVKKVNLLLENDEIRFQYEKRAKERFEDMFSFHHFAKKYIDYYERI